jgi:DNA-binding transcriptional LysR family regulator
VPLLERGEVHIGIRHDQGVTSGSSLALPSDDVLPCAACRSRFGRAGIVDIVSLASSVLPLTRLLGSRLFNAACRVADVDPNIVLESRALTLLALAEAGQGWLLSRPSFGPIATG